MIPGAIFPAATELDRVAEILEQVMRCDDWWGPARWAFDAEVNDLCTRARMLAADARVLP